MQAHRTRKADAGRNETSKQKEVFWLGDLSILSEAEWSSSPS